MDNYLTAFPAIIYNQDDLLVANHPGHKLKIFITPQLAVPENWDTPLNGKA